MTTKATTEQIEAITRALKPLYIRLFEPKSCDAKYNAQQNLSGRTHYVDTDTLRWHKSRVLSSSDQAGGLLFRITTSDSLDMHNTKRGTRCVVFDLFGTTVYRPDLDQASKSSTAAQKACSAAMADFDLVAHYRQAIHERLERAEREAADLLKISQDLAAMAAVDAALATRNA
jgi:hypothetical protein